MARELAQQFVAGKVPQRFVDHLELVKIEIGKRVLMVVFVVRLADQAGQAPLELFAAQQASERIVGGPVVQLFGQQLVHGDVGDDEHRARRRRGAPRERMGADAH